MTQLCLDLKQGLIFANGKNKNKKPKNKKNKTNKQKAKKNTLREKCRYSELFWSVFYRIQTE